MEAFRPFPKRKLVSVIGGERMYRILVVEDDRDIINILSMYLENAGMKIDAASSGEIAFSKFENNRYDLVLMDLMLPVMDGYTLTRKIRAISNVPIIMMSAKIKDSDVILGLDMGADDYITKPFNPLEVVCRVKCHLRRFYQLGGGATQQEKECLVVGKLELDQSCAVLRKEEKEIPLTSTEFRILRLLMQNPGRIYTKVQIYEAAVGEYYESDENAVMVHISRLRDKIETDAKNPEYIKTIRGLGYKIEKM